LIRGAWFPAALAVKTKSRVLFETSDATLILLEFVAVVAEVAVIVPLPLVVREAPVPIVRVAVVFVPEPI